MTNFAPSGEDYLNLPDNSPGATVPYNPPRDEGVLRVTAEEWERRAAVAEGAAEALATAGDEASRVLLMNAFGKCVEGQALYDALARVIGAWQQELSTQKGHAIELANVCRRAGGELGTADSEASQGLRA